MLIRSCPICGSEPEVVRLKSVWLAHTYKHQHDFNVGSGARLDIGIPGETYDKCLLGWNNLIALYESGVNLV
jgi:hypothetical protein